MKKIQNKRVTRLAGLVVLGLLTAISANAGPLFRLPLAVDTSVHYFYDDNRSSGVSVDWNCGGSTYDNHNGTDFSGGPRGTAIYAAAVGTLKEKVDGFGDGYVGSPDGGGAGNHVVINHGGSPNWHTWYMHMTAGSVTTKGVGSSIACGEKIGGVGTSGSSSGLHLHFGVYPDGPNFVHDDPYAGPCGGPLSYWVNQNGGHPTTTCQGGSPTKTAVTKDNPSGAATGTWATGTSSTDKFGTDYRYHSTAAVSEPFTWTASLNVGATWNVRAWWPQGSNRSTTAPYMVQTDAGTSTVNKNQQINGGSWQLLGSWAMSGTKTVKLSCWTSTGYIVVADAVKWD